MSIEKRGHASNGEFRRKARRCSDEVLCGLGLFGPRMWYRGTLRPRRCAAEVESIRQTKLTAHRRCGGCQMSFAQVKDTTGWLERREWTR